MTRSLFTFSHIHIRTFPFSENTRHRCRRKSSKLQIKGKMKSHGGCRYLFDHVVLFELKEVLNFALRTKE